VLVWPFQAETGPDGKDQPRVSRLQSLVAKAHSVHDTRPKVVDHHICAVEQMQDFFPRLVALQVKRQALLVAIQRAEDRIVQTVRIRTE